MFFKVSNILNYKWIRWFPLLIIIPVIIISIFTYQSFDRVLTLYVNRDLYNNAQLIAGQIDNFIDTNKKSIGKEASLDNFKTFLNNYYRTKRNPLYLPEKYISVAEIQSTLNALKMKNSPYSLSYALISNTGDVLYDTEKNGQNKNESQYFYFKNVINTKSVIMDDIRFQIRGNIYLIFAAPIFNENHQIIGILRVKYSPAILQQYVNVSSGSLGKNAYSFLFDENFLKLADGRDPNSSFTLSSYYLLSEEKIKALQDEQRLPNILENIATEEEQEIAKIVLEHKQDNASFFKLFSDFNSTSKSSNSTMVVETFHKKWYVLYIQPEQRLDLALYKRIQNLFIILLVSFILVIIISLFVVQLLSSLQNREDELNSVQKELKKLLDLERKWNKEIEDDLSLGREIQEAIQLIPELPKDITIVTDQNAAQFVSGDTYFINWNSKHNLCTFFLQDIVGHGVQAALKASISHQIAKNIWSQDNIVDKRLKNYDKQLQEFFDNLHQEATDFNALLGAEFNTRTHMLRIYRSNYVSPFLIKPDQEIFSDTTESKLHDVTWFVKPLALKNRTEYQHALKPGSILILLSDGYLYNSSTEMSLFRYLRSNINNQEFLNTKDLNKYPILIKEWFNSLENPPIDDRSIIVFQWLPNSKTYKKSLANSDINSNHPNNSSHFSVA